MFVVADTNVVISMLLWGKSLEPFFVMVNQRKVVLCFSPETIDELVRVIRYPKIRRQAAKRGMPIETLIDRLLASSVICYPKQEIRMVSQDESDNRILETATACGAYCIVTGDRHLLRLKKFGNVSIITPSIFLKSFLRHAKTRAGIV